jgi:hypothetical protein
MNVPKGYIFKTGLTDADYIIRKEDLYFFTSWPDASFSNVGEYYNLAIGQSIKEINKRFGFYQDARIIIASKNSKRFNTDKEYPYGY